MTQIELPSLRTTPFVAGAFAEGQGGVDSLINPWTGGQLADVTAATAAQVDDAIAAARQAFDGSDWPHRLPADRGAILHRIAATLLARSEAFARVEALNSGKPLLAALREIEGAARVFTYYAGAMDKFFGETIPLGRDLLDFTLREPLGVVAQIVPWNFPLLGASWKLAPALAAGCCCVLKPAPQTPLTALLLAEVCAESGVPAGVLSILPGGADVGRQLSEDPRVDGIAFTGSTFVGSEVMRMAAATIKKVALELGGKNANIVFADSNLSRAAESAAASGFGNAGQSCSARSRLIVERAAMPAFVDLFRQAAAKLRFGAVDDPATSLGPLITARHRAHVAGCVETAHTSGARILSGGKPGAGDGFFYEATILGDVLASNPVFSDEVFGPVVSITPFDTEVEAIALANASEYGLNGSVWARDIGKALRVARGVRTGMMAVNGLPSASRTSVYAPFGGVKRSGIGRELGLNALDFYTEVKNVVIDLG